MRLKVQTSAFGFCLLVCSSISVFAQAPAIIRDTTLRGNTVSKYDFGVVRSRNVVPDVALLRSARNSRVVVPLFDRKSILLSLESQAQDRESLILRYTILGDRSGRVTIVIVKSVVTANIVFDDGKTYQIRYVGNGVHSLREIDQTKFPNEGEPLKPVPNPRATNGELPAADTCTTDPPESIDVLVVYTDDARVAAGGTDAMLGTVYLAVEEANQSYINSDINQRLRLVHVEEVNYAESGDFYTDLPRLRNGSDTFIDTVPTLRDTFAADVVSMITESGNACGLGYFMSTVGNAFENSAYSVVARSCATGYFSFAHELGHNMGADHDTGNSSSTGAYAYDHGFTHPSSTAAESWRTIMSYSTTPSSTRVQYWSNPNVNYPVGSVAMGTAATEDNHRVLNNTAATVANFRCSSPGVSNVWMKDTWNDTGVEPNPNTAGEAMWQSPYIWVRNSQDTGLTHQHEHQNPEFGSTNWVYVKLHNGASSSQNGNLELYYAQAASGLSWPADWTPLATIPVNGFGAHTMRIVEAQWTGLPGTGHYCIIARWNSGTDPMATAETSDINANTLNNNNIIWRNLNIVDLLPDASPDAEFILRNVSNRRATLTLSVKSPAKDRKKSFFDYGQIALTVDGRLFELIRGELRRQPGIKIDGRTIIVANPNGIVLRRILTPPKFETKIKLNFKMRADAPKRMYEIVATQLENVGLKSRKPRVIGGVSYYVYNFKRY